MTLIAYVSGHGLGHSTREIEILRHLPPDIPLVVKTSAPEKFWREELSRPFTLIPAAFDVGCIQKNGLDMDIPATLRAWQEMAERNRQRFDAEVADLRERKASLILTDVPSFPIMVATALDIPSICVANFTWADIYQAFVVDTPDFVPIVDELIAEYQQASLHLEAGFSLPMSYFPRSESVGLVARPGVGRGEELSRLLPDSARGKRLALVYVGGWGLPIAYEKVGAFADWHFLSLDPPPALPPNWTVLPRETMPHPDFVASVDAVISKPGYGIGAECVRAGTPLLYPPRPAFAEYAPMHAFLSDWAGGISIPTDDFLVVNWRDYLDRVPARGVTPCLPANGGPKAAEIIADVYRDLSG